MRSVPESLDAQVVDRIDAMLDAIAQTYDVALPLAIESGSRAWGFPSPDSDYDCRFIYVRPVARHLTPWAERDVIEVPGDGILDANGWDLAKALRLLMKGNAVIIEWLRSPIVYRGSAWFRDELLALARNAATRGAVARHYLHLGTRQRNTYFGDGTLVAQKKIFYALRPAATLRWLRLHESESVAPMNFQTLMAECEPPDDVLALVDDLLRRKALSRELGEAPLPSAIARFIDEEFAAAGLQFEDRTPRLSKTVQAQAERFYKNAVERLDAAPRPLSQ